MSITLTFNVKVIVLGSQDEIIRWENFPSGQVSQIRFFDDMKAITGIKSKLGVFH
jgi:hypothetical protein